MGHNQPWEVLLTSELLTVRMNGVASPTALAHRHPKATLFHMDSASVHVTPLEEEGHVRSIRKLEGLLVFEI